ncbi:MAG TPA: hypothetical protein VLZ10_06865 [Thermodesulfobacteriota bacterium]|nr:hypothetical protein [Thermodesulfobacteriota bacterium]
MKETHHWIQVFLVIAISSFILAFSTYLHWTQLSQAKFVSSDLIYESQDQEERLSDSEKELKVCGSSAPLMTSHPGAHPFEQSSSLFSETLLLPQKTFILRC